MIKINTILDHIDNGHMALPEFQRGYVWGRDQVRGLFDSLYREHPVGSLLVWVTPSDRATHRGEQQLAAGVVKLLLDGQQRITSLYGVIRGKPPAFFEGNATAFTGLYFHLDTETFAFYQPTKMSDDLLWVDVSATMLAGPAGLGAIIARLSGDPSLVARIGDYVGRLSRLLAIAERGLHIEEVTGADKTLDVVVDIFNRVNSGGTKLSKGDLALAKICADRPASRKEMNAKLAAWRAAGFYFDLDWLLRCVNTLATGEARFLHLHNIEPAKVEDGIKRASRHIDTCLNLIGGRLGLDHDQVLFGRFAIAVMIRLLDQRGGQLSTEESDKLLFWFVQAAMWGRFSGSTESFIDADLAALEEGGIDAMLELLRLWHGGLRVEPGHFTGWSLGARFYPVLYMLTRMGEARDWGSGLPLKANMLGKMSRLEVHHIFPKAQLYKHKNKYGRAEVNALANFCFLTKDSNLRISATPPEKYFVDVESRHPGALASQWIPEDPLLWKIENFRDFLAARKVLLANELNARLEGLLHGDTRWLHGTPAPIPAAAPPVVLGGIADQDEEQEIIDLNRWMTDRALTPGRVSFDYADPQTGLSLAVFDLVWPAGVQENLSEPVALLLNEPAETLALANKAGLRCFTQVDEFQRYITDELMLA